MSDCRLDVVETKDRLLFSLSSPQGAVRTLIVAVVHASNMELLWLLGAVAIKDAHDMETHTKLVEWPHVLAASLLGDTVAHEQVLSLLGRNTKNNTALTTIVYGEEPRGFQQAYPQDGRVPQLRAGIDYGLCMWWAFGGFYRFEIRHGH